MGSLLVRWRPLRSSSRTKRADDASDALIASSNTVSRFPADMLTYLPLVLR
jgi:hypothetical protein